jgi:hypothetical protein
MRYASASTGAHARPAFAFVQKLGFERDKNKDLTILARRETVAASRCKSLKLRYSGGGSPH